MHRKTDNICNTILHSSDLVRINFPAKFPRVSTLRNGHDALGGGGGGVGGLAVRVDQAAFRVRGMRRKEPGCRASVAPPSCFNGVLLVP